MCMTHNLCIDRYISSNNLKQFQYDYLTIIKIEFRYNFIKLWILIDDEYISDSLSLNIFPNQFEH